MRKELSHIKQKLQEELPYLQKEFHVSSLEIFGSFVKGGQTEASDLDILVKFNKKPGFFRFIELEQYLSSKTGLAVDLVTEEALKPYVKEDITSYKLSI